MYIYILFYKRVHIPINYDSMDWYCCWVHQMKQLHKNGLGIKCHELE